MNMETLIEDHLDSLWYTALRLTRHKEEAEDLVQDTCMKALIHQDTLKSPSRAKAWLLKIQMNTFLNHQRKHKKLIQQNIDEDFLEPIFFKNGHYFDMEEEIFSKVLDDEVQKVIDQLSVEFRVVILLVDIEGLAYREVEDILEISSGTLASRLYRARRLLRTSLYDYAQARGFGGGEENVVS